MKLTRDKFGYFTLSWGEKELYIQFGNDWAQLLKKYKWNDFTLIEISGEQDFMFGGLEFNFYLLGLGFHLRYNYKETGEMKELVELAEKYKKK